MCQDSRRKDSLLFHRVLCLNVRGCHGSGKPEEGLKLSEEYGPENVVVLLGELVKQEAAGLAAETVTAGDPTPYAKVLWQESSWD